MKKSIIVVLAVGIIAAVSVGAYAHGRQGSYGRGGYMHEGYGGPMMGWMHGPGSMMGRWGTSGGYGGYCGGWSGWNAPSQSETVPQAITEDKAKEVAEAYITKYLPGYTIETITKDTWRPLYVVTLKGANEAELQMLIHGFGGQVMHVFPKTAEE